MPSEVKSVWRRLERQHIELGPERTGRALLIAAAVVVGIAILASGSIAKGINGIAGILWFVAAGIIVASLWRARRRNLGFAVTFVITLTLVLLVKPADVLWAALGFTVAGAIVAFVFAERPAGWATLIPALWLPCHLLVAAGRAIGQELIDGTTHVRTSPPPTAAIVPLVMVLAAWLGGVVVIRARRTALTPQPPSPNTGRGGLSSEPRG